MHTRKIALVWTVLGCLMMAGSVLRAGEPSVAGLIGGLKSSDEAARLKAVDQLGAMGEKAAAAVAPLTELLADGSAKVRAHAAWSLGAIGAPAKPAVPALAKLLKDPDENVRRQAVRAVQAIHPGPEVMIPLCVALMEDTDPAVRVRVLRVMADAGVKAVPGLIKALKNEKAAYWACLVLREIGPDAKDAVPALAEALKNPRAEIRREAVLTLGAMNEAADSVLPQIVALLKDEHARTAATFVLGQLGKIPADAEQTVRAGAKSDDKMLATVSLWALARVHLEDKDLRRQATEELIARLKDTNPFVRVTAARALAELPPAPEITAPIWEKAMQDADPTTVHYALDAMAVLGAPAVPRLIDALKHEKVRANAAYILGRIGPAAAPATDALAKLIDDKNADVAQEAVFALAHIGPGAKDAVPALIKSLQQGEDKEASAASIAHCLGKIGPAAAAAEPELLALLKGPDRNAAVLSAWALGQIRPNSADIAAKTVPVLVEGLALPIIHCRRLAAEALADLGPLAKVATAALQKAASDADPGVRAAAAKAISAVGGAAPPDTSHASAAIKPGDSVIATEDVVAMKSGTTVAARFAKGTELKVLEIQAPWVGVQAAADGQSQIGWVLQTQVKKP